MISIHFSVFLVQAIKAIDADIAQQLLLWKKHIDELTVVDSSDAVMKVRYVEPDPAGFQKQVSWARLWQENMILVVSLRTCFLLYILSSVFVCMVQVSILFAEWYQICELPGENDAACTRYVLQLHQTGLLKGDEKTESFFRILTVI